MRRGRVATVSVPASSGNIGPGFDVLGMALDLRNQVVIRVLDSHPSPPRIEIYGEGKGAIPTNSQNVLFKMVAEVFKKANKKLPSLEIVCENRIPVARGLGSSSAATLAGLLAGNALLGYPFSMGQILDWAAQKEGHPDNVASALLGGVVASTVKEGHVLAVRWPVPSCRILLAIPDYELRTIDSRKVLPRLIPLRDAVSNLGSVSLMAVALKNQMHLLRHLLDDKLHEPYRSRLVPGFQMAKEAGLKAGAYGITLSGSGPTVLSFVPSAKVEKVREAMDKVLNNTRGRYRTLCLTIDRKGAWIK